MRINKLRLRPREFNIIWLQNLCIPRWSGLSLASFFNCNFIKRHNMEVKKMREYEGETVNGEQFSGGINLYILTNKETIAPKYFLKL